jgi:hypothetical protein
MPGGGEAGKRRPTAARASFPIASPHAVAARSPTERRG